MSSEEAFCGSENYVHAKTISMCILRSSYEYSLRMIPVSHFNQCAYNIIV